MCEKVNTLLKGSNNRVLDNSNIKEKQLGKRGLRLNAQGDAILASNFRNAIRNQKWISLDSDLVFNDITFTNVNLFLDNSVNIVSCNSVNFNQQSQSITICHSDMISPNRDTDSSDLIGYLKHWIALETI